MAKWTLSFVLAALLLAHAGAPVARDAVAHGSRETGAIPAGAMGAMLAPDGAAAMGASPKTSPPIPRLLLPATGYWYDAERPGTGFALERRGNTLGVVFYHFSDVAEQSTRAADWHLANGPLQGGSFEATLLHFNGGSCLGCDPFAPADAEQTDIVVRLVFTSAREATLQVGDGEPRRVVALPYGVPYEGALATPPDLPLPDLRGRWVVVSDSEGELVIALEERITLEDGVEYRGVASGLGYTNASMRCDAEGCMLRADSSVVPTPVPVFVAQFQVGDITEERMTGADGLSFHVRAFRLPDDGGQP